MFGGHINVGAVKLTETWEWDGSNWLLRTPANNPSGRDYAAMAYDSARGQIVLFGGYGNANLSETWEYPGP